MSPTQNQKPRDLRTVRQISKRTFGKVMNVDGFAPGEGGFIEFVNKYRTQGLWNRTDKRPLIILGENYKRRAIEFLTVRALDLASIKSEKGSKHWNNFVTHTVRVVKNPLMVSKNGLWPSGLLHAMRDSSLLLIISPEGVVIKDKYPKAKHHFLVLPNEDIPSIFQLRRSHLDLLSEMHLLAVNAIEVTGGQLANFKIGFHARPSMERLHLHVISTDFISDCLKTKLHWNSFNTSLFLPYEDVVKELTQNGAIRRIEEYTAKQLAKSPLKCNKCSYAPKNMPDLKMHLRSHLTNK